MARLKQIVEGPDGWSDWQYPVMAGYKLACCDCGLVHDVEFEVVRVTKINRDGTWQATAPKGNYRVGMRARRNNRSTALARRKRK
jgi:hypothetical protein